MENQPEQSPIIQPETSPNPTEPQPTTYSPSGEPQPNLPTPGVVVGGSAPQTNMPVMSPNVTPASSPKRQSKKLLVILALVIVLLLVGGGVYALVGHKTNNAKNNNAATSATQKSASHSSLWPIASPDGTAHFYDVSSLATTATEKSVVQTLASKCATTLNSSASNVVVDTDNQDYFNSGSSLYLQSGNFIKAEAGCANENTTSEQASTDYATYLQQYILEQKGSSWTVLTSGSTEPYCSTVDHIGIPATILNQCFDQTTNQERAPVQ
jgi:hypothetical protein